MAAVVGALEVVGKLFFLLLSADVDSNRLGMGWFWTSHPGTGIWPGAAT